MKSEKKLFTSMRGKFFTSILASMVLLISTATQAGESSCVSLFSRIADQFNKLVPTYVDIRMEAAQLLAGTILPDVELDEITEKLKQAQIDAYKAVGEIVGDKNSPGSVNLVVPYYKYEGSSFAERTFIVSNNSYDRVNVKVKKTGGKNGADIIVCKYTTDGDYIKTKEASIDKGKDTAGVVRNIEFKGMKNEKYLTIHIVNRGFVSDKFNYELTVTGEFDEEKLAEEKNTVKPLSHTANTSIKETSSQYNVLDSAVIQRIK